MCCNTKIDNKQCDKTDFKLIYHYLFLGHFSRQDCRTENDPFFLGRIIDIVYWRFIRFKLWTTHAEISSSVLHLGQMLLIERIPRITRGHLFRNICVCLRKGDSDSSLFQSLEDSVHRSYIFVSLHNGLRQKCENIVLTTSRSAMMFYGSLWNIFLIRVFRLLLKCQKYRRHMSPTFIFSVRLMLSITITNCLIVLSSVQ